MALVGVCVSLCVCKCGEGEALTLLSSLPHTAARFLRLLSQSSFSSIAPESFVIMSKKKNSRQRTNRSLFLHFFHAKTSGLLIFSFFFLAHFQPDRPRSEISCSAATSSTTSPRNHFNYTYRLKFQLHADVVINEGAYHWPGPPVLRLPTLQPHPIG